MSGIALTGEAAAGFAATGDVMDAVSKIWASFAMCRRERFGS